MRWNVRKKCIDGTDKILIATSLMKARGVFVPMSGKPRPGKNVPQKLHGIYIHLTPISGWKDYVVLEASDFKGHWHIGWKIQQGGSTKCQAQKLRIHSPYIKMLTGRDTFFFGMNEEGEQIPLRVVGRGTIGDGQFLDVRLF